MHNSIMIKSPCELIKKVTSILSVSEERTPTQGMVEKLRRECFELGGGFRGSNKANLNTEYVQMCDVRSMMESQLRKKAKYRMTISDICLRIVNMNEILTNQGCIEFTQEVQNV